METFQRPPLAPLVADEISQSMDEIDRRYWPQIIGFRVARFIPPDIPVPRQRPYQLLELFKSYAKELYEAEASQYEPFRASRMYVTWLANLNNRIAVRLQEVYKHLDESDPDFLLGYHGISNLRIDADAREAMFKLGNQYTQGPAPSIIPVPPQVSSGQQPGNRERIEKFILKMTASGLKVKRKDIWQTAGYQDRTEFERFQRGDERNKAASLNFNRIINLELDDFRKQIEKLNR